MKKEVIKLKEGNSVIYQDKTLSPIFILVMEYRIFSDKEMEKQEKDMVELHKRCVKNYLDVYKRQTGNNFDYDPNSITSEKIEENINKRRR